MPISANIADRGRPLEHILATEGEPLNLYKEATITYTVVEAAAPTTKTIAENPDVTTQTSRLYRMPYIGRCMYVRDIVVSASQSGIYQVGSLGDARGFQAPWNSRFFLEAGKPFVIPVNEIWDARRFSSTGNVNPVISFQIRRAVPNISVDTAITGDIVIRGTRLTDDLHWYAQKTLLVLGDSLSHGDGYGPTDPTTGTTARTPTKTADMWSHKVRDWLKLNAVEKDWRLCSIALPGYTSSDVQLDLERGRHDCIRRELLIYALGTNDALTSVSASTYDTNIKNMWQRHHALYPRAPMLVLTPAPMGNSADETAAGPIRAQALATVAAINDPLLRCVNLGAAWPTSDTSFFRTTADLIHWSNAGHSAVSSAIQTNLTASGWLQAL